MAAAIEARPAGEKAVAIADMADVLIRAAGCDDRPGTAILPDVKIVLGIKSDDALSRGAGGGLDAYAILQGAGHQAIGICLAQVVLREEGELVQIL